MYSYKKRPNKIKRFFSLLFLMILVSAISIFIYQMYENIEVQDYEIKENDMQVSRVSIQKEEKKEMENVISEAVKSVVGISKIKNSGLSVLNVNAEKELGLGSGIIITDNGYIATNWHVTGDKYSNCYVTLDNGNIYNGSVVWADKDLDLSIVKIQANGLKNIEIGDSDALKLGEEVYAIGNPIGIEFERTVTKGIISGLNRTLKIEDEFGESYMEDLIQTDATINNGNSGGPLINSSGEVIGITTIKITSAEGIGFAVPIKAIKTIIEKFATESKFEEAYLGIFAYDKEVIPYLKTGIKFDFGIYVVKVMPDGPLREAGIKEGDIITKIDDTVINKMSELKEYVYNKKPQDEIALTINRNGREYTVKATLGRK